MKIQITNEDAARFQRLEYVRRGLDSTLRVQMERSMELYADHAEDMHAFWLTLEKTYNLPIDGSLELRTDDRGVTFFIQEMQKRRDRAEE